MRAMRGITIFAGLAALTGLTGCKEEQSEVQVTETRELTTSDRAPKLMATSQERFGQRQPQPQAEAPTKYVYEKPETWSVKPATEFRQLNFVAGEAEIYVSEARGGVSGNIGRWMRQFGKPAPTEGELSAFPRWMVLGGEGILAEASGTYSPGMGRPASPGFALAGVIGQTETGILTVKMVGPEAAVKAEMTSFREFCASLQLGE
jgi:hypothetical protein